MLAAALLASRSVRSVTVYEFERGLPFSRGRFSGVLGPGIYWHLPRFTRTQKVDTRPAYVAVTGQEVLSADGVAVKTSIAATYRVADPRRAVLETGDYTVAIHLELQLALRALVSTLPVEELLQKRADLGP